MARSIRMAELYAAMDVDEMQAQADRMEAAVRYDEAEVARSHARLAALLAAGYPPGHPNVESVCFRLREEESGLRSSIRVWEEVLARVRAKEEEADRAAGRVAARYAVKN